MHASPENSRVPGPTGPEIDLWGYVDTAVDAIWRRRWLILVAIVISVAYSVQSLASRVPVFTATATILVEQPNPGSVDLGQMLEARGGTSTHISTYVQLLQSRSFIEDFLRRQDMLPAPLPEGSQDTQEADTASDSESAPAGFRARMGELWQDARARIEGVVEPIIGTGERGGLDEDVLPARLKDRRLTRAVSRIRSVTRVRPVSGANLIEVSWTDRDRVYATQMANEFVEAFIAYNLETQNRLSEQAGEFLTAEIDRLSQEILGEENRLGELARSLGIDETSRSAAAASLGSELAAARSQRIAMETEYRRLQDAGPSESGDVANAAGVRALRDELAQLRSRRETQSRRLTDEHPQMKELLGQISDAEAELRQEEQSAYQDALSRKRLQLQAARETEQQLRALVTNESGVREDQYDQLMEYRSLETTLEHKQGLLEQFRNRRSMMEVSAGFQNYQGASVQIVEPPLLPPGPANKPWRSELLWALLMGAGIGAVIAVGLDYLDNTLRTPEDVERRLAVSTLGTITTAGAGRSGKDDHYVQPVEGDVDPELVVRQQPRSRMAEEYRELRTALLLSTGGGPPRSLVLTSATPGEGKTTSAVNLAMSLANAGKKVLLIDADMRRPRVKKILQLSVEEGLSNYLAGGESWKDVIVDSGQENLWVVPSGPVPPNPAELLGSDLPRKFLDAAKEHFDITIIDSPPVLTVVDALIVAAAADGVVIVARASETAHQMVAKAIARVEQVGGRVLGVALNGVKPKRRLGYGRYSYYYRQYGYGYRQSSRSE